LGQGLCGSGERQGEQAEQYQAGERCMGIPDCEEMRGAAQ
jgi:hypothetical protein